MKNNERITITVKGEPRKDCPECAGTGIRGLALHKNLMQGTCSCGAKSHTMTVEDFRDVILNTIIEHFDKNEEGQTDEIIKAITKQEDGE